MVTRVFDRVADRPYPVTETTYPFQKVWLPNLDGLGVMINGLGLNNSKRTVLLWRAVIKQAYSVKWYGERAGTLYLKVDITSNFPKFPQLRSVFEHYSMGTTTVQIPLSGKTRCQKRSDDKDMLGLSKMDNDYPTLFWRNARKTFRNKCSMPD